MIVGKAASPYKGGEYRNSFEYFQVNQSLKVLVPSVVRVEEVVQPLFSLSATQKGSHYRQVKINARCLEDPCVSDGLWITDNNPAGRAATEYFHPRKGLVLDKNRYLPSVLTHVFGLIGACLEENAVLAQEANSFPEVGLIVPLNHTLKKMPFAAPITLG